MSATVRGDVADGFGSVADAFARNLDEHGDVGGACAVYRDAQPVVDIWGGLADRESGREWERDTVVIAFSCTKGATAVMANRLIEDGRLDPDEPVATYWPEFAANGKEGITVGTAMSHRAGLAAIDADLTLDDVAAWDPVVEAIAAQATNWEPGTAHGYHSRTYGWIVGEIIHRITGVSPGTHFARTVAEPLGLDFFIGVPEEIEPRVATLYPTVIDDPAVREAIDEFFSDQSTLFGRVMSGPSGLLRYDETWNTRRMRAAEMPSSNGHGDARSLARMYAACTGEVDGVRLLAPETVARATEIRSEGKDLVIGQPLTIGLGFMLPPTFPPPVGPRTFGHSGAGGSTAFVDPDAKLSFAYVMNQMQFSLSEMDPRGSGLVAALYESMG